MDKSFYSRRVRRILVKFQGTVYVDVACLRFAVAYKPGPCGGDGLHYQISRSSGCVKLFSKAEILQMNAEATAQSSLQRAMAAVRQQHWLSLALLALHCALTLELTDPLARALL